MVQNVKVKYGFHIVSAPELDIQVYTIKLRFLTKNVNDTMKMFFESLGFNFWFGKKDSIIFSFYTKDYTEFETKTQKVREYLIRNKITKLYEKLAQIIPASKPQPVVLPDLNF